MAEAKLPTPVAQADEGDDLGSSYADLVEEVEVPRVGDDEAPAAKDTKSAKDKS